MAIPPYRRLSESLTHALAEVTGVTGVAGAKATPALCRDVVELSRLFTCETDEPLPSYLDDDGLRAAYQAYYLPVNLVKVQALLAEMPTMQADDSQRPLSVLDLGGGPGTGALAVLDWLAQSADRTAQPVTITVVDRAATALEACERLWRTYQRIEPVPGARLIAEQADLERPLQMRKGEPYDLIILANCLTELFRSVRDPVRRRANLVRELLGRLQPNGTLMIVEPALREPSRDLHRLRDLLVAEGACTVYSPCLHERSCPALVKPDDWCHEERPWTPPPIVAMVDRQVGFIKDALKFSYLLLRKDGQTIVPRAPTVFRVVSELREMKGEKRAWLCNETGRPEVGRLDRERSATNEAMDDWHRGAIVRIDQIVHKGRKERESMIGRIPAQATVEVLRSV
ncbi:MAG: hypothetical protein HY581_02505 [Nitrospirae bacterium]|nr:hypothetical protein [Nitrospirota bacterium]